MKTTALIATSSIALLLSAVSLVITLIQSPSPSSVRILERSSAPLTISGGQLFVGSPRDWIYDSRSQRLRYEGKGSARQIKVILDKGPGKQIEEILTREPATRLGITVKYGDESDRRILLLESDRDGGNLELTLSDESNRLDSNVLQILPNLLRDPLPNSRITEVKIEGCQHSSGVAVMPYQLGNGQITVIVQYELDGIGKL